jgi:hypothetical protein
VLSLCLPWLPSLERLHALNQHVCIVYHGHNIYPGYRLVWPVTHTVTLSFLCTLLITNARGLRSSFVEKMNSFKLSLNIIYPTPPNLAQPNLPEASTTRHELT